MPGWSVEDEKIGKDMASNNEHFPSLKPLTTANDEEAQ